MKNFLIIGNLNSIAYESVFYHIKRNEIWCGCKNIGSNMFFGLPEHYKENIQKKVKYRGWKPIDGEIMGRMPAIWYTNLDHNHRHEFITLKDYNESKFQKYKNYDAIEVSRINDIPDYDGVMGVPLTFFGKYNPNQFEILGLTERGDSFHTMTFDDNRFNGRGVIELDNGELKPLYARILIRKKKIN